MVRLNVAVGDGSARLNVRMFGDLPGAGALAQVLDAIGRVMQRHDALRSRFGPASDGAWQQVVAAAGEVAIDIYDSPLDLLLEARERLVEMLARDPFGVDELPVRFAVICVRDEPAVLAMSMNHLASDGVGSGVLLDEIAQLSADPAVHLPDAVQQAELLAYEDGTRGQRQAERADAYLRRQLATATNRAFPVRPGPETDPPVRECALTSSAVSAAAHVLAKRSGTTEAAVLFAALGLVVCQLSGLATCTVSLASPNRLGRLRSAVVNLFQLVPASLHVRDATFGTVAQRAHRSIASAYQFGRFDPVRRRRTVRAVTRERGVAPDLSCMVNLRLSFHDAGSEPWRADMANLQSYAEFGATQIRALAEASTFEWKPAHDQSPVSLGFSVWGMHKVTGMTLLGHSQLFSETLQADALLAVERVLVEAVAGPELAAEALAGLARLPSIDVPSGLRQVDGCWVDPAEIRDLVASSLPAQTSDVFVTGNPAGATIEAWAVSDDPAISVQEAHTRCVDRLGEYRYAIAPHRYLLCPRAPAVLGDRQAWLAEPVRAQGSGRD